MSIRKESNKDETKKPKVHSILSDFDYVKRTENERRKRERLEEVRKQSKEIAAKIRENVKVEKRKHLQYVENIKKKELKSWKERNVTMLHNKYEKCLKNHIGVAHRDAEKEELRNKELQEEKLRKEKVIAERSKAAAVRHKEIKQQEENIKNKKLKQTLFGKNKLKSVGIQVQEPEDIIYLSDKAMKPTTMNFKSNIISDISISDSNEATSTESLPNKLEGEKIESNAQMYKSILISSSDEESTSFDVAQGVRTLYTNYNSKHFRASKTPEPIAIETDIEKPITAISDFIRNNKHRFSDIEPMQSNILAEANQYRPDPKHTSPAKSYRPPTETIVKPVVVSPQKLKEIQRSSPKKSIKAQPKFNIKSTHTSVANSRESTSHSQPISRKCVPTKRFNNYSAKILKDKENIPMKRSILSSPTKLLNNAAKTTVIPKVQYYDYDSKLDKEYEFSEDLVVRLTHANELNAMEEAQLLEEAMKANKQASDIDERRSLLRGEKALERELIRKDYDKLTSQLEAFSKEEKQIKARCVNKNFADIEKINRTTENKQKKMDVAFQNILKDGVIITCPPVNPNVCKSNSTASHFNVANVPKVKHNNPLPANCIHRDINSSDSCTSIILDSHNKEIEQSTENDNCTKVVQLQELLEKIQHQKEFLLNEMENCGKESADQTLDAVINSIENLEKQKHRLIAKKEENMKKFQQNIAKQETYAEELKKIKKEKERLNIKENKLCEPKINLHTSKKIPEKSQKVGPIIIETNNRLKKNQFEIKEISSSSSIISNESSVSEAPVKIIIRLSDKLLHKSSSSKTPKRRKSPKYFENIQKSPGKVYPKTPLKKSAAEAKKQNKNKIISSLKQTNIIEEEKDVPISKNIIESDRQKTYPEFDLQKEIEKKANELYEQKKKEEEEERQLKHKEEVRQMMQRQSVVYNSNDKEDAPTISSNTSTIYRDPPSVMGNTLTKLLNTPKFQNIIQNNEVPVTKPRNRQRTLNPTLTRYITRLLGMSRQSIEQLGNGSTSEITTPSQSIMDASENIATDSLIYNENKIEDLKRFIDDNYNFLNEINDSLRNVDLSGTSEENVNKVQNIWMNTLKKKENDMRKKKINAMKIAKTRSPQQKRLERLQPGLASRNLNKNLTETTPKKIKKVSTPPKDNVPQATGRHLQNNAPVILPSQFEDINQKRPDKRKSILKTPTSILPREIDNANFIDLSKNNNKEEILQKYSDLTQNCSSRIAELSEMIKKVRDEKRKIIEYSLSSSEPQNSTEYMDLPYQQNNGNTNSNVSPLSENNNKSTSLKDDQPSDEIRNILQQQNHHIGVSKDSGIAMSRPVTASDIRDSPDVRLIQLISPEKSRTKDSTIESHRISRTPFNSSIKEYREEEEQNRMETSKPTLVQGLFKKLKPPAAMSKFNSSFKENAPAHELSTIIEVDTPGPSKINTSLNETDEERVLKRSENLAQIDESRVQELQYEPFPNFDQYVQQHNLEATQMNENYTKQAADLLNVSSISEQLQYQKFPSPKEYIPDIISLSDCTDSKNISSESSISDIVAELKRRNIITHSFAKPQDSTQGMSVSSSIENDEKTTPTTTKGILNPVSPRKMHQYEARLVTPGHRSNKPVDGIKTPTKKNPYLHEPVRISKEPSKTNNKDSYSGIGLLTSSSDNLENDLNEMGLNWAASMLKKNQEHAANVSSDSTSPSVRNTTKSKSPRKSYPMQQSFVDSNFSGQIQVDDKSASSSSIDSHPLNLREFINRELLKRTQSEGNSDESSISQKFLKSLLNMSNQNTSSKTLSTQHDKNVQRTSTPVQTKTPSTNTGNNSANISNLFSGESRLSSVRMQSSDSSDRSRLSVPDIHLKSKKIYISKDSSA